MLITSVSCTVSLFVRLSHNFSLSSNILVENTSLGMLILNTRYIILYGNLFDTWEINKHPPHKSYFRFCVYSFDIFSSTIDVPAKQDYWCPDKTLYFMTNNKLLTMRISGCSINVKDTYEI